MIIECSNCRQYVEAKQAGSYWRHFEGREPSRRYTLLACTTCQEPILVGQTNIGNMAEGDKWDTPFVVFPQGDIRVNPRAPIEIRAAFQEACTCYRTQAFTASAIMCRKTLEGICACIDPALSAQIRLLKHKPQRGSSYPAPDVGAGGCKSGSSRQSHDWRVVASRTGGGARIGP